MKSPTSIVLIRLTFNCCCSMKNLLPSLSEYAHKNFKSCFVCFENEQSTKIPKTGMGDENQD